MLIPHNKGAILAAETEVLDQEEGPFPPPAGPDEIDLRLAGVLQVPDLRQIPAAQGRKGDRHLDRAARRRQVADP